MFYIYFVVHELINYPYLGRGSSQSKFAWPCSVNSTIGGFNLHISVWHFHTFLHFLCLWVDFHLSLFLFAMFVVFFALQYQAPGTRFCTWDFMSCLLLLVLVCSLAYTGKHWVLDSGFGTSSLTFSVGMVYFYQVQAPCTRHWTLDFPFLFYSVLFFALHSHTLIANIWIFDFAVLLPFVQCLLVWAVSNCL